MEIDERLKKEYEGNIRCDLCERELDVGEPVDVIQTGMFIERGGDDPTTTQYGGEQEETVLCKPCSTRVKVTVHLE